MSLSHALEKSVSRQKENTLRKPMVQDRACAEPEHLLLGKYGEDTAVSYLAAKGYKIIARNIRYKCGEIDIAALDGNEAVIVEVRTRKVGTLMPPEDTVGPKKLKKLMLLSRIWEQETHFCGFIRIDIVAITINDGKQPKIEHIKDISGGILQ